METSTESTLVVLVPEAEPLVGPFRARHDPVAAEGVPAHVTVLYPFVAPARITAPVEASLAEAFRSVSVFETSFSTIREFPGVLYLAPSSDYPFRRLTEVILARFPETPPYGGRFADVVPHLTVAHGADAARLARIRSEFEAAARTALPIVANIRDVALLEKRGNRWHERRRFALAAASQRDHGAPSPGR